MSDALDYINQAYRTQYWVGQRVRADGTPGVIVGAANARLLITNDDGYTGRWHPTWRIEDQDDDSKIPKLHDR